MKPTEKEKSVVKSWIVSYGLALYAPVTYMYGLGQTDTLSLDEDEHWVLAQENPLIYTRRLHSNVSNFGKSARCMHVKRNR